MKKLLTALTLSIAASLPFIAGATDGKAASTHTQEKQNPKCVTIDTEELNQIKTDLKNIQSSLEQIKVNQKKAMSRFSFRGGDE